VPRVRTPTTIRKKKGNPGKRPYNKREPKLKAGEPTAPDGLDADSKSEWKRLISEAFKLEVLTKAERAIITLAALAYSTWMRAERELDKNGLTYETEGTEGQRMLKANPAATIAADAWRRYKSAVIEIGLSPAARSKVNTVDASEEDDAQAKYFH